MSCLKIEVSRKKNFTGSKGMAFKLTILKSQPININGSILYINLRVRTLHGSPLKDPIFAQKSHLHLITPQFVRNRTFDMPDIPFDISKESKILRDLKLNLHIMPHRTDIPIMHNSLISLFRNTKPVTTGPLINFDYTMILPYCLELDIVVIFKKIQLAVTTLTV